MIWTFDVNCFDCKYCADGKCKHRFAMYCEHSELWAPKVTEVSSVKTENKKR